MSAAAASQGELFERAIQLPEGMRYVQELLSPPEEQALIEELGALPFKEFEFHGFLGRRRVLSFGWRYDFNGGGLQEAAVLPKFLLPLRERAARFAGLEPASLEHALLIEYAPGAGIGWHRDRPDFEDVIGISLRSPCTFRLRRRTGARWERLSLTAEPRSAYLLRGSSRSEWAHSIPPLQTLRYSITFRSLAPRARRPPSGRRGAPSAISACVPPVDIPIVVPKPRIFLLQYRSYKKFSPQNPERVAGWRSNHESRNDSPSRA